MRLVWMSACLVVLVAAAAPAGEVSGRVTMAVEEALTDQDRAEGYILACQAKIQGDVEVDA